MPLDDALSPGAWPAARARGIDGSTTYHQDVAASASDVKVGGAVRVELGEGFRPDQVARGDDRSITLGTAGDVTVVP